MEAGQRGDCDRQPAHGIRQHAETGSTTSSADGWGLIEVVALAPDRVLKGHPATASPGTTSFKVVVFTPETDREAVMAARVRGRRGPDRRLPGVLLRNPRSGDLLRDRDSQPRRRRAGPTRDRCRAAAGAHLPVGKAHCGAGIDPGRTIPTRSRRSTSIRSTKSGRHSGHQARRCRTHRPIRGTAKPGEFAAFVGRTLGRIPVQMVGDPNRPVLRVALACGAGDDFLKDAAHLKADVLLTGEARFHRGVEADALGIALVTAGHYATERLGVEDLACRITVAFPALTVWPSRSERDPVPNHRGGNIRKIDDLRQVPGMNLEKRPSNASATHKRKTPG